MVLQTTTAADPASELRAEIARRQVQVYRLAARVGMHPNNLGQLLRGRRPLSPELAARIERALRDEVSDAAA
jgi:DNA-binding transcriptional regulator YdaS (Cro superfamily)